jgi:predicted transcriptional regulator
MPPEQALLLSVRPRFAEAILAGSKRIELRRTRPNVADGTRAVLYSSTPTRAVVGAVTIASIEHAKPAVLWPRVAATSGLSLEEYRDYFHGASAAFGLHLRDVLVLRRPVSLGELRNRFALEPAQSFRYLSHERAQELTIEPFPTLARPSSHSCRRSSRSRWDDSTYCQSQNPDGLLHPRGFSLLDEVF